MITAKKKSIGKEGEMKPRRDLGKKNSDMPLGYSGRIALRREQCNMYSQAASR
jgi:hypothetical protein